MRENWQKYFVWLVQYTLHHFCWHFEKKGRILREWSGRIGSWKSPFDIGQIWQVHFGNALHDWETSENLWWLSDFEGKKKDLLGWIGHIGGMMRREECPCPLFRGWVEVLKRFPRIHSLPLLPIVLINIVIFPHSFPATPFSTTIHIFEGTLVNEGEVCQWWCGHQSKRKKQHLAKVRATAFLGLMTSSKWGRDHWIWIGLEFGHIYAWQ